jgi:hypothetical protein
MAAITSRERCFEQLYSLTRMLSKPFDPQGKTVPAGGLYVGMVGADWTSNNPARSPYLKMAIEPMANAE